jgi:hypothetical protein
MLEPTTGYVLAMPLVLLLVVLVEVEVEVLSLPGSMISSGCSSEHSCEIVSW